MRELWHAVNSNLEEGQLRAVPLQCMWIVPENEQHQSTVEKAEAENGK